MSNDVLQALGGRVDASGLRWLAGEQGLSASALTAKVLCERHNVALSPLDKAAGRLFREMRRIDQDLRSAGLKAGTEEIVIAGADVERWMLKCAAGLVLSGNVTSTALRPGPWIEVLFGEEWPPRAGLYVDPQPREIYAFAGVEIVTHDGPDALYGASFDVAGVQLMLLLGDPRPSRVYRPAGVRFERTDVGAVKGLTLAWPNGPQAGYLELQRAGSYDGPRPAPRRP